ncbi:MAG: AAA family ATPase [Candidatus Dojkabacteria bacterium]|nr:AAA family ATPase [Candidatus Dojkabacteria bacterium]
MLGEPGVGKTFFLRYLATRMVVEDVPESLYDYRLVVVDLNRTMSVSGSVDGFKSVLNTMFEEVISSGNIILVFEDIGQIFGLRDEGRAEVISLISGMINKYNIKVLATASKREYESRMKTNKGFSSLFEVITIEEPSNNIAFQIVMDFVPFLEKENKITVRSEAVKRIVEFGENIMHERVMPDKGIVLLEDAILQAKAKGLDFLDDKTVNEIFEKEIGVNVGEISEDESKTLINLEETMHERVIGQDKAILGVANALRRARSGITSGKRPIASFLFYGPTGVGKTEVAKTLAETYYGDENLMIRVDMSEYQEEINLDRLIGYTDADGNFLGGYLTEAVRTKPFSLILLDELEKANPKVLDLFLQVLDEGRLTDGLGREVNFRNTVLIATSNAGSRQIADLIIKGKKYKEVNKAVEPVLREVFRVEFLNRFDKVVMFKPLSKIEVSQIAHLMLKGVNKRLEEKGIVIKWDMRTLGVLAEEGYNSVYGARELRRTIQDEIEDKIAQLIISNKVTSGSEIFFSGTEVVQIQK